MGSNRHIATSLQEVEKLDLSALKRELRQRWGWSCEHLDAVEAFYRRFLALKIVYPGRLICPTDDIDAFWNAHIFHACAYERDCRALFGHHIHHYPYLGMHGRGHCAAYEQAAGETRALFIKHFGMDPGACDNEAHGAASRDCA